MNRKENNVDRNGIPIIDKPHEHMFCFDMFDFEGEPFDDTEVEDMIEEKGEENF